MSSASSTARPWNKRVLYHRATLLPTQSHIMAPHDHSDHPQEMEYIKDNLVPGNSLPAAMGLGTLLILTASLIGIQLNWTIEMAYGTPYLLSLGLSASAMSLVWLAGPISGLIMHPVIGVLSDACTLRLGRRRPFIIAGTLLVNLCILVVAFTPEIAAAFLTTGTSSNDNKDDRNTQSVKNLTIVLAVIAFYLLDFAINAVQAACRALIVDVAPVFQQAVANAYASKMIGIGNCLGFLLGFVPLPALLGISEQQQHGQLKVLCVLAVLLLTATVTLTCTCIHETPLSESMHQDSKDAEPVDPQASSLSDQVATSSRVSHSVSIVKSKMKQAWCAMTSPLVKIVFSIQRLPPFITKVCHIQFFSWIGWFPLLFYSSSWVASQSDPSSVSNGKGRHEGFDDHNTRIGSLAMLLYSLVSVITGVIAPLIAIRQQQHERDASHATLTTETESDKSSNVVLASFRTLPALWTMSQLLFSALMFSTMYITSNQALACLVIALCGISWGITLWIPFTLIGEYVAICVNERAKRDCERLGCIDDVIDDESQEDVAHGGSSGYSMVAYESVGAASIETVDEEMPLEAGVILGIHNMYIVLPQFISTIMCASTFAIVAALYDVTYVAPFASANGDTVHVINDAYVFGWPFRLGGIFSLIAAYLAYNIDDLKV